jgi:hypothetical protein
MINRFLVLSLIVIAPVINAAQNTDVEFAGVAEEFIKGYLNARPLLATRLGFHEYDGRADDFSRLALMPNCNVCGVSKIGCGNSSPRS